MSLSLVIRRTDGSCSVLPDGEALFDALEVVDEIAEAADLRGIADYSDDRDIPDDFDGDLDDLRELLGPPTVWFDAVEAADNFDAVAAALGDGEGAELAGAVRSLAAGLRASGGAFVLDVA